MTFSSYMGGQYLVHTGLSTQTYSSVLVELLSCSRMDVSDTASQYCITTEYLGIKILKEIFLTYRYIF
jgi:hypothetical protein